MNVLIADDHPLYREALRGLLRQLDNDISVLEASNFEEALKLAADDDLDLLLLDLRMPGIDWFDALEQLRALLPSLPIVMISASNRPEDARRAIQAGALGYIPKHSNSKVILNALRLVLSGGTYVPPLVLDMAKAHPGDEAFEPPDSLQGSLATVSLSPRQREVLALMSEGKSNREIARRLDVAVPTVKLHITAIFKALGVSNRTEAVVTAAQMGLTSPIDEE